MVTVEPPVSDSPKCKAEWSLTGAGRLQESNHREPLLATEKRSWRIYFIEDNLLHAMSKLRHV